MDLVAASGEAEGAASVAASEAGEADSAVADSGEEVAAVVVVLAAVVAVLAAEGAAAEALEEEAGLGEEAGLEVAGATRKLTCIYHITFPCIY